MKYNYPPSIDTPEGRKVFRRLKRKIARQREEIRTSRDLLARHAGEILGLIEHYEK